MVDFSNKIRWQNLSEKDIQDIYTYLSPIILPNPNDNEEARKFDTLILKYLYSFLIGRKRPRKISTKKYMKLQKLC